MLQFMPHDLKKRTPRRTHSQNERPMPAPHKLNGKPRESSVVLYDASTIDTLKWPETAEGASSKRFLLPLVKNGVGHYLDNIQAEMFALKAGPHVLPLLVPAESPQNSYVCSPYNHYIALGKESIGLISNPLVKYCVLPCLNLLGRLCRAEQLDSVVYVNNGMFAIDLYPENLPQPLLAAIVALLKERFPTRAILFRSLTPLTNAPLMEILQKLGFGLLASRHVFITDASKEAIFHTRIFKSDLNLWNKSRYEVLDETQLSEADCPEMLRLERLLYVIQHSQLQPQFNINYMLLLFKQKLLKFKVLKMEGQIKGVAGYFEKNGVMYCPFFGYDKEDADHTVIYRLLNTALLLEAQKSGVLFNQSAGAAFYKSIRRAEGCQEWMAVYNRHLKLGQKFAWRILMLLLNTLGPRYMRKY